jgi:dihydrofolate reductase
VVNYQEAALRTLTYLVASTIDGFIAPPDGSDPSGELLGTQGEHMSALVAEYPDIVPVQAREVLGLADTDNKHFDTVVEGRNSYETGLRAGVANAYPHLRHLVFSRTLTESPDPGVELVATDPVERIRELKQEDGKNIWLVGGAGLARSLRSEIDELMVKLHPVAAGAGIPLFGGEFRPQRFRLVHSQAFDSGVLHLTYRK